MKVIFSSVESVIPEVLFFLLPSVLYWTDLKYWTKLLVVLFQSLWNGKDKRVYGHSVLNPVTKNVR